MEKTILSYELEARTRPDILRVVLGPCVQYCSCEASAQKLGPKTKIELKEIDFSYCHHLICLKNEHFEKNNVKMGWKITDLCPFNVNAPKWQLAYFVPTNGQFVLPSIYINFDIQTKLEVNQTQIGHSISKKTPKTHQSGHISKPHFAQVSFTKKPTPPTPCTY